MPAGLCKGLLCHMLHMPCPSGTYVGLVFHESGEFKLGPMLYRIGQGTRAKLQANFGWPSCKTSVPMLLMLSSKAEACHFLWL